jgi:hypothetical protein
MVLVRLAFFPKLFGATATREKHKRNQRGERAVAHCHCVKNYFSLFANGCRL